MRAAAHDGAHPHEPDAEEVALGALADAELAFAARALSVGRRAALLTHLEDDGVAIEDAVQDRSALRRASRVSELRFEAAPAQIGVARAHDLGYATGACAYGEGSARQHGVFLNVWRRPRPGVPWRIALATVTCTPAAVDFVPLGAAPRPAFAGGGSARVARRVLLAMETRPAPDLLTARRYRAGVMPVLVRDSEAQASVPGVVPRALLIAGSADLAVSHGTFVAERVGKEVRTRPYVHVWLRDAPGAWRLAFDVQPGHRAPRE